MENKQLAGRPDEDEQDNRFEVVQERYAAQGRNTFSNSNGVECRCKGAFGIDKEVTHLLIYDL